MRLSPLLLLLLPALLGAAEPDTMVGRQTRNEGLLVLPKPGPIAIDGQLGDWDLSGRIRSFAEWDLRDVNSVETAALYDAENLYLAFRWRDPTPLQSSINPEFNASEGWRSDAVQMRIHTDRNLWITTWYYTAEKIPVMHLSYWQNDQASKSGQDISLLRAQPGGTELGQGVEMAYRAAEDGKGFVQEVKIPWKLLYRTPPAISPGLGFQLGLEFIWGDEKGGAPAHRYADNLQPGTTSREFFWTAVRAWGAARLSETGHVPVRDYQLPKSTLAGTIPIRLTIPEAATHFTVVLENERGERVRNLVGDVAPRDYGTAVTAGQRAVEILWDARDDAGKLVPAGTYAVRGLTRGDFDATFDSVFYNPGTPPWYTVDGTGGFGSNHAPPLNVARAGERMILGFEMSEGGHAILGYDAHDRKIWGENRGASQLAAEGQYVYAISRQVWTVRREMRLLRLSAADGSYQPFVLAGKPRPFDLEMEAILGLPPIPVTGSEQGRAPTVTALAVSAQHLALGLADGRVVLLDKQTAQPVHTLATGGVATALAYDAAGQLFAVLEQGDARQVAQLDLASGQARPFPTPEVAQPKSLAFNAAGELAVSDAGPESDVKVYTPAGRLLRTLGKKGGRPGRGFFDPGAMSHVNAIAYDAQGRLWAAEKWNLPRRFSVWQPDGRLARDFVGGTGYAATSTFLHDSDPDLAYVGPVEMRLDRARQSWAVTRILWQPEAGEAFAIDPGVHTQPHRFTSRASGQAREYFFVPPNRRWSPLVLLMEKGDHFQPVAAMGTVLTMTPTDGKGTPTAEPPAPFNGHDVNDGFFWNDLNGDARLQAEEVTFVPAAMEGKKKAAGLAFFNGWGARMSPDDLSYFAEGVTRFRPTSFSAEGAPRYGPEGMVKLPVAGQGDLVPVPGEKMLLNLSGGTAKTEGVDGLRGLDPETGAVRWTYPNPYPSVHGSHRAPMSQPGLLVGPLKIMGTARLDGAAGSIFALRGNMGEDYFFTTDGLFAGTLFQDTRRPSATLPATVEALRGASMAGYSEGGEPFSGWFARQSDGQYRLGTSIARSAGLTVAVQGLDSIHRFQGGQVTLTAPDLARADAENAARATVSAQPKSYIIRRAAKPWALDGKPAAWARLPAMELGDRSGPGSATVKLAYDAENLYAYFEVADASPLRNTGKDFAELFKSGDAVDLQLATQPSAARKGKEPVAGDLRLLLTEVGGQPQAVLMRPVEPGAPKEAGHTYASPVGSRHFARVELLSGARLRFTREIERYTVEAAIPLAALGLKPEAALEIRGDVGFISSDAEGLTNIARTYWSNQQTGLVNDLPGEAELRPALWGSFQFSD